MPSNQFQYLALFLFMLGTFLGTQAIPQNYAPIPAPAPVPSRDELQKSVLDPYNARVDVDTMKNKGWSVSYMNIDAKSGWIDFDFKASTPVYSLPPTPTNGPKYYVQGLPANAVATPLYDWPIRIFYVSADSTSKDSFQYVQINDDQTVNLSPLQNQDVHVDLNARITGKGSQITFQIFSQQAQKCVGTDPKNSAILKLISSDLTNMCLTFKM